MNPGYKVICIESGPITFSDKYGETKTLPPVPELTIGKVYTVEELLLASETGLHFDFIVLVEEKGQGKAAYYVNRFDLYGM